MRVPALRLPLLLPPALAVAGVLGVTAALAAPAAGSGDPGPGGPRILFVRGGPGTGGFLEGGADEQLSDVFDHSTAPGNHGFGELRLLLEGEGYVVEQMVEGPAASNTPVDLVGLELGQYAAIVLGSNNADYPEAAADAVEAYVRAGGGLLVVSDANWGRDWGDAPSSDQTFLDRFGLVMNQDTGTYVLSRADRDFVVGGVDGGTHPILAGPDGIVGTADDVGRFDGEGVSPITLAAGGTQLAPVVLARAEGSIHLNDSRSSGSYRPATVADGALVVLELGGRVAGHFDRNTFFNANGAGTSLHRFDNARYARNLFAWLVGPAAQAYGRGKRNSLGTIAALSTLAAPSIAAGGFRVGMVDAVPGTMAVPFVGTSFADAPFLGGTLLVGGSTLRLEPFVTATDGGGTFGVRLEAGDAGRIDYYQVWYRDAADPTGFGVGLSEGLRVRIEP